MSRDLQLLGRAGRTHDGYLREVRKLACHFGQAPDALSEQQVGEYLLHLINDREFAPGSLKVTYSGIKFFYTHRFTPSGQHKSVTRTVSGQEFVRGFVQHTLPSRLQRIRYYGWQSPNYKLKFFRVIRLPAGKLNPSPCYRVAKSSFDQELLDAAR